MHAYVVCVCVSVAANHNPAGLWANEQNCCFAPHKSEWVRAIQVSKQKQNRLFYL